ncbi:MAG: anti-sigma factor antagonist [Verrucomicrobia bacterium]|jgi:anti-anti-sigma factor|nr:anti-sigma factor antagonist [Verrucomicrobiota bacterium]
MSDPQQPTFLVNAYADPVVVKVMGKANYLNCNSFREFIGTIIEGGCRRIFIDFTDCKGMDSTFLGILAGTAIELRKLSPAGELVIGNLSERNYELIGNLGLQNLLTVIDDAESGDDNLKALENKEVSEAKKILEAHQNLTKADKENEAKFQDVIAFLQNQVEEKEHT